MKKFMIWHHGKSTSIIEVEVQKLGITEDPDALFRKSGEWFGRVISPDFVVEKDKFKGSKPLEAMWFVFFDSPDQAKESMVRAKLQTLMKKKYLEEGVLSSAESTILCGITSGSPEIDAIVVQHLPEINAELDKVEVIML